MNAIPMLKPIEIAVCVRPTFDNTHLGVSRRWISDNTETLARYFRALTAALDMTDQVEESDADLDCWLLVQHDIELQHSRSDNDPTPWCLACGASTPQRCKCGQLARNE